MAIPIFNTDLTDFTRLEAIFWRVEPARMLWRRFAIDALVFCGRSHWWLAESVKATLIIALWRSSVLVSSLYFSGRAKFRQRPPPRSILDFRF